MNISKILAVLLLGTTATLANAGDVSVSIGGMIKPGVYGQIDLGGRPPPPVVYAQPVWVQRPAVVVGPAPAPLYIYAPRGHIKHWAKHCAQYNACGRPVYFVQEPRR
jgi:hypothetical protein